MALLCTAQFVDVLGVTVVVVALPAIQADLGLAERQLHWVVSAYALCFGGFLLPAGRAGDLYGRRRLFAAGLALFTAASLACGLAGSVGVLVAARAAQGLGAAMVVPAALALLVTVFPSGPERSRALGAWTAAAAGGGVTGFFLGGVLTGGLGWRWVFLVNVPVGALALALTPLLLPRARPRAGGRLELLPPGVLRSRPLLGANLAAFTLTAVTSPAGVLGTLYLQEALGYPAAATGLALLPFSLAAVAGSLAGGRLHATLGARATVAAGMGTVAAAMLLESRLPAHGPAGLPWLVTGLVVAGAGLTCASVAATATGTAAVPAAAAQGLASGLLNTAAQVGTAAGIAALVTVAAARTSALAGGATPAAGELVAGLRLAFLAAALFTAAGAAGACALLGRGDAQAGAERLP